MWCCLHCHVDKNHLCFLYLQHGLPSRSSGNTCEAQTGSPSGYRFLKTRVVMAPSSQNDNPSGKHTYATSTRPHYKSSIIFYTAELHLFFFFNIFFKLDLLICGEALEQLLIRLPHNHRKLFEQCVVNLLIMYNIDCM